MYYVAAITIAAAFMQFFLLPMYIRLKNRERFKPLKITIKGFMTLIAFGFATFAVIRLFEQTGSLSNLSTATGFRTNIMLPVGLLVCTVADILLCINFPVGMLCFLAGHICYITYFIMLAGFSWYSLIPFVVGVAGIYKGFRKHSRSSGKMWPLYMLYGTVIMTTLSLGIILPLKIGAYGVTPAIAVILLVVSDIMLGINKVHGRKVLTDLMYLGYYFMGQFILAMSVFVPVTLGV